ncbi:MAG TPA: GntR family transcriptional regulator [Candidatus Limnocylindrales bacterium]|jgi:DNA-binding GntR family transcriptional regulator
MTAKHVSLAQQAYATLKRDIISCALRPGDLVVESELAARYGMSKTPIREALNLLRNEGFVQILPRRGTLIRPIDVQDVQHTFFLRMLIEPEAAALAATRATGAQLKHLTELVENGGPDRDQARSQAARLSRNRLFHAALAEASGIPRLVAIVSSLHEEVERFYNSERLRASGDPTGAHHHALLEAIVTGDSERARQLMTESIKASRQHLIELLLEDPRPTLVTGRRSA